MKKIALALIPVILATSGCSWWKTKSGQVKQGLIDCAKADLSQVTSDGVSILMEVMSIIYQGGDGWQDALAGLSLKYGDNLVACAVKVAEEAFTMPQVVPGDAGVTPDAGTNTPVTGEMEDTPYGRAHDLILLKGWTYR